MRQIRRLILPVGLLVSGVIAILIGVAGLLSDQWLQSGDPIAEGRIPEVLTFTAEERRYVVRMGRRREVFGDGPTVRVNPAVARGALCLATLANEKQIVLQRETHSDQGGITPDIDTFAAVPGRTTVECQWSEGERWRGDLPFFVAAERTTLRRLAYGAIGLGIVLLLLGGARLWRVLSRP